MNTRVAVTGATGFIGGRVVARLRGEGFSVIPLGRRRPSEVAPEIRSDYLRWDICRGPLVLGPEVESVVHCAGAVDDWGTARRFERVNVGGTRNVILSWPRPHLVHISSSSVYPPTSVHRVFGEGDADPYDRGGIEAVRWFGHYGRTKLLAEHEVVTRARGRAIVLRPPGVYGRGDRHLLPRLLRRHRLGRLLVAGTPGARLSLTSLELLADAVVESVKQRAEGVFNVADDDTPTLDAILRTVLRTFQLPERISYLPARVAWSLAAVAEAVHLFGLLPRPVVTRYQLSHLTDDFILDAGRLGRELGVRSHVPTLEGIRALGQRSQRETAA